jgi:hypothetical protein
MYPKARQTPSDRIIKANTTIKSSNLIPFASTAAFFMDIIIPLLSIINTGKARAYLVKQYRLTSIPHIRAGI